MCDRILVMHHGRIEGEIHRQDFSEKLILSYAAGLTGHNNKHQTMISVA
jgi:ABC-type sugar transport system ATPase subunit